MNEKNYTAQLKKIKKLDPEEERALWLRYKAEEDGKARQELIRSYLPLVFKAASSFQVAPPLGMELVQEGTIGLIEAVENFDINRGVHFSVYARFRIRGRMLNFLTEIGSSPTVSLDQPLLLDDDQLTWLETVAGTEKEPSLQVEQKFITDRVLKTLERLPDKEQRIIQAMYLDQGEAKKVAEKLAISLPHFYRLQKKGIKRMRGMLSRFMAELKV